MSQSNDHQRDAHDPGCHLKLQARQTNVSHQDPAQSFQPFVSPAMSSSPSMSTSRASSVLSGFEDQCVIGRTSPAPSRAVTKGKNTRKGKDPLAATSSSVKRPRTVQEEAKIGSEKISRGRQAAFLRDQEDCKECFFGWEGSKRQRASNGKASSLTWDKGENFATSTALIACLSSWALDELEKGNSAPFKAAQAAMESATGADAPPPLANTPMANLDGRDGWHGNEDAPGSLQQRKARRQANVNRNYDERKRVAATRERKVEAARRNHSSRL
ncbi:hypothetical protein MBLNU230_g1597t1 [Neophaeotheca triangularis]